MAWVKLADRLAQNPPIIPLVLAGPILRQVTSNAATVWIALQKSAKVTLSVFNTSPTDQKFPVATETRRTYAVGKNLHITALTARTTAPFIEGLAYQYDLSFDTGSGTLKLDQAVGKPGTNPFSYPPFKFPSFVIPPADLNKLRIIHGSCRKAHGGKETVSQDALVILNTLIADTAERTADRPHQLILTGDQIYADEVADQLLFSLTDAGDTLLGWNPAENLPGVNADGKDGPYQAAKLLPLMRSDLIKKAGFTSEDTRSHLMSLGEYFAMYLYAWSDVLWTGSDLKTLAELQSLLPKDAISKKAAGEITTNDGHLKRFLATLPTVRTVLANIPTYMICDDHDVTDDWNMTRGFCLNVYRKDRLGIRIIQNALVAYAICQAWGNKPEQFAEDPLNPPGLQILKELETSGNAKSYDATLFYQQSVGIVDADSMVVASGDLRATHASGHTVTIQGVPVNNTALDYNFTIEGKSHQIIVTDTRTWRDFERDLSNPHGRLLPLLQIFSQIQMPPNQGGPPDQGSRLLLVVFTTNFPPTTGVKIAARNPLWPKFVDDHDLFDSWDFPSKNFDQVIVGFTKKVSQKEPIYGAVVVLSGDCHYSFSSRLTYWAEKARLGDSPGNEKTGQFVVAQLVSSSLNNQNQEKITMQGTGYTYHDGILQGMLMPPHDPEGYVGWNLQKDPPDPDHPKQKMASIVGRQPAGWFSWGTDLEIDSRHPTLGAILYQGGNIELIAKPDYRYRLDYLQTTTAGQHGSTLGTGLSVRTDDRAAASHAWAKASQLNHDFVKAGAFLPEIVGYNNIGEITFVWQADNSKPDKINKRVVHTIRWQEQGQTDTFWAAYDVSLNIDDSAFPKIKAHKGDS